MATGELVRKLASTKKKMGECGQNGNGNADQKSSELAREKMWSRIHLIPVLQAEEDRDLVRRQKSTTTTGAYPCGAAVMALERKGTCTSN
jgi:hypothetical protein